MRLGDTASQAMKDRLNELVRAHGTSAVIARLKIARGTIARLVEGREVHRGTLAQVTLGLRTKFSRRGNTKALTSLLSGLSSSESDELN